ncbi:MAG TPA: DsbA family protein [Amaricoccus sp.]|uniref:DsbA family protein n=1 Tax=Amaricoccus sp. TaxID=1872485 RepID=UPI002CD86B1A|nr:DsbA family protein [Amaricoccus sp.]HMQ92581.1 DsbA family protein [Amaricoccus sp.]HMR51258.1 DsbA family protein [Amaricoccus sp.]HMR60051.1 DsbA family protein [Amaricoccus sp.]HMT97992.1 DsbA family protein [Amaricoccus sp.]
MTPALSRRTALALSLAALALPRAGWAQAREIVEMTMGSPDAPVTLVEYAMFTCPHCKAFQEEVFPQIKENFIDTGKVRLVYREVYFNRPSLWAAMIARCAPADRYFGIVDLLFERQAEWSGAFDSEPMMKELYSIGRQAGLTDEEMQACVTDRAFAEALVAEFQKNAAADGIDATPTFLINGTKVSNMNYADFEAKLNEALGE